MIDDLLDHTCDIYHPLTETVTRGYGLPDSTQTGLSYPSKADISAQKCHFGVKTGTIQVVTQEPQKDLDARLKLTLPIGTDIRKNDKIVSGVTGFVYIAEIPRNIRGNHISVMVIRQYPRML